MNHMFDIDVAKEVGVIAAILFQNIAFWCQHSEANGTNFFDGRYWTYNTNKAFCEIFPYLSSKNIRTGLQKLMDAGLILTGNYNQKAYDRTIWYTLSEKGKCIFQKGQMDLPIAANGIADSGEPIPYINTNRKPNINNNTPPAEFDEFWNLYPRKLSKQDAIKAWKALSPDADLVRRILDDLRRRAQRDWRNKDVKYIPYPATYIRGKRWEDEPVMGGEIEFADEYEREEYYKELWRRRLAEPGADTYEPPH